MPSTVVHMAFAALIGAALLGSAFDRRSVSVLFGAMILADLDSFVGLFSVVGHRTAFHTLLIPITAAGLVAVDLRRGERSWLRERWGARGIRVTWVTILAYAVAAIGLDLFSAGGANPFWPVHDQFYFVNGKIELSSQRGIVQTFVDLSPSSETTSGPSTVARGSSQEVNVSTGIDPQPDGDGGTDEPVDRVFPVVRSGWQLLLLISGTVVTAARFYVDQTVEEN
jgi:hypothetical protein